MTSRALPSAGSVTPPRVVVSPQIPGFRKHGLVHVSQMASYRVRLPGPCADVRACFAGYLAAVLACRRTPDTCITVASIDIGQVEKVEDCVAVGDQVWVKVTGASQEDGKLSFSMKLVDQGDGVDLDPDNSEADRQVRSGWGGDCLPRLPT